MVIPIFKSHYSIGRSILTLEKPEDVLEDGPDSIINLCLENKIKNLYLVEDSIGGFLQGYINSAASNLDFRFGLRLTVCDDMSEKNEESKLRCSKYIIFANNKEGYQRLIKINTTAAKDGFYYTARADFKTLKKYWDNKDLSLCVPFYDSFLHRNAIHGTLCVPNFDFTEPTFFIEDNDLYIDQVIKKHIEKHCENGCESQEVKSIFYKDRKDFKSYLTFRCINNRSSLDKPELEGMNSAEFCLQSWKEANGRTLA
jgi:DNA polymerase III alpha subunit